jgi:peptidyl-prolyl cis-trans isomerase SurA
VPNDPADLKRLREQVLKNMVDEKLQLQEAKKKDVTVTDKEIQQAVLDLGKQNNMPNEQFAQFLKSLGPSATSLGDQLHAEIAWNKLLRKTIRVEVGDDEVEAVINRLKENAGQFEYLVAEIFLISDTPTKDQEVQQTAERLVHQIRDGSPFQAIARQFSESATAANGGMVGWVQQGQLDPEVEDVVTKMRVKTVSDPIKTAGGYYIVELQDRRRILSADPRDTQFKLMQVVVPVPKGIAPDKLQSMRSGLESISSGIKSCDQVPQVAESVGTSNYGNIGTVRAGDLPDSVQNAVMNLKAGQATEPILSDNTFRILVVCDRKEPEFRMPSEDEIANNLFNQRLGMLARRYLRDLRRDAIIDYK